MIKDFKYSSKGEVRERHVFILHENAQYLEGLDFSYLTDDEKKDVQEVLKDHVVSDIPPRGTKAPPIKDYKPEWNKAWRRFKKDSIVNDKKDKPEEKAQDL